MLGKKRSILLFVNGLTASITPDDIRALFAGIGGRHRRRLSCQNGVCSCDILRISYPDSGQVEYHALVEVHPAKLGLSAIRELNGSTLKGHRIEMHRYHHRSSIRDRRRRAMQENLHRRGSPARYNRRTFERRRGNPRIELVEHSEKSFLPSLGRLFHGQRTLKSYS